jgi:hypothetical protein
MSDWRRADRLPGATGQQWWGRVLRAHGPCIDGRAFRGSAADAIYRTTLAQAAGRGNTLARQPSGTGGGQEHGDSRDVVRGGRAPRP